ncbi:MAG TPA: hypothetical protein VK737_09250, partial [Opitutales bacterium]|nr:hypothetical protein [Opitutales bacterium]
LCYDLGREERALTWKPETGYTHDCVDDGESNAPAGYKGSPILVPDGAIDFARLQKLFAQANTAVPSEIVAFVNARLQLPAPPRA